MSTDDCQQEAFKEKETKRLEDRYDLIIKKVEDFLDDESKFSKQSLMASEKNLTKGGQCVRSSA